MRKLYLLSKPTFGKRHLIGVLSEKNGEYQFEYKLGGKLPEWWLAIKEFPDYGKVYKGEEVMPYIKHTIPSADHKMIKKFLEAANLMQYDEWGLLKYCGKYDPRDETSLMEKLPDGVRFYE
jgi:hypothetical protein